MTHNIINRGNADFSLSPVRDDAVAVVFEITEFRKEGRLDLTAAPECVRQHAEAAIISPILHTEANQWEPETTSYRVNAAHGSMVVPVAELAELLDWFDREFPDWRTKRGAYSPHAFLASDYTDAEVGTELAREAFWARAERYGDSDEPAGAWV